MKKTIVAEKEPWIKGGAIIAIDPNNGEILAMASHPRYDPNDFIPSNKNEKKRNSHVLNWLENESYLAESGTANSLFRENSSIKLKASF